MGSTRDEYVSKLKAKLDEWNADMDRLMAKAESLAAAARQECEEHVGDLRSRRADLEAKLHELSTAAEGVWHDLKAGVDGAAESLAEAIRSARKRFTSSEAAGKK